tara:strand:- start:187 stop:441 length:255 start_codon:yes stop_codon:yes gene_type:complete
MSNLEKDRIINELKKFVKSKNKFNTSTELDIFTDLFEEGYLDSFGLVQLILIVEKKFKINISKANFFKQQNNINSISDYILKKR